MFRRKRRRRVALVVVLVVIAAVAVFGRFSYAPLPSEKSLANPAHYALSGYDVLGRYVSEQQASELTRTAEGRRQLSPANNAVHIDERAWREGRKAFYRESYGNEVFLTDVMGMLEGGLSVSGVSRALIALHGRGTHDLKVPLAKTMRIGERFYKQGELVSTGLDVPRGGLLPLGIKMQYDRGHLRMGITCALCHSAVDPVSLKAIDGAPNNDLAVGLMMALASNSAAYFMHTGVEPGLTSFRHAGGATVTDATGGPQSLPDADMLEATVKSMLASWPPGSFDSTPDLVNNPASIPSSFAAGGSPYGWSGHAGIGAFRGLSALNNNVHGLNSDTTAQALQARVMFDLDPEVYLATLLQRAASPRFRYLPGHGTKPSVLLDAIDPTPGQPGLNQYAALPTFPHATYLTSNSLIAVAGHEPVGHSIDAMSVFQIGLRAPPANIDTARVARGAAVFEQAGCGGCHSGAAYTNNQVLPAAQIGTEPTRARAFRKTEALLELPPKTFAGDTPTPPPADAQLHEIPLDPPGLAQVQLAWAHAGSDGGYKVPNLIGLAWSAPYLHDAGVAVGADAQRDRGIPGTGYAGVAPDPVNSLLALVDRERRADVVAGNRRSPDAAMSHVSGAGHEFWVDAAAGFANDDQRALVAYLLSLDHAQ
jgi:hypothetical protein